MKLPIATSILAFACLLPHVSAQNQAYISGQPTSGNYFNIPRAPAWHIRVYRVPVTENSSTNLLANTRSINGTRNPSTLNVTRTFSKDVNYPTLGWETDELDSYMNSIGGELVYFNLQSDGAAGTFDLTAQNTRPFEFGITRYDMYVSGRWPSPGSNDLNRVHDIWFFDKYIFVDSTGNTISDLHLRTQDLINPTRALFGTVFQISAMEDYESRNILTGAGTSAGNRGVVSADVVFNNPAQFLDLGYVDPRTYTLPLANRRFVKYDSWNLESRRPTGRSVRANTDARYFGPDEDKVTFTFLSEGTGPSDGVNRTGRNIVSASIMAGPNTGAKDDIRFSMVDDKGNPFTPHTNQFVLRVNEDIVSAPQSAFIPQPGGGYKIRSLTDIVPLGSLNVGERVAYLFPLGNINLTATPGSGPDGISEIPSGTYNDDSRRIPNTNIRISGTNIYPQCIVMFAVEFLPRNVPNATWTTVLLRVQEFDNDDSLVERSFDGWTFNLRDLAVQSGEYRMHLFVCLPYTSTVLTQANINNLRDQFAARVNFGGNPRTPEFSPVTNGQANRVTINHLTGIGMYDTVPFSSNPGTGQWVRFTAFDGLRFTYDATDIVVGGDDGTGSSIITEN